MVTKVRNKATMQAATRNPHKPVKACRLFRFLPNTCLYSWNNAADWMFGDLTLMLLRLK